MLLAGKKGLVLGVTNEKSIGWGIAQAAVAQGARVGLGAQNDKLREKVERLVEGLDGYDLFTCDLTVESDLTSLRQHVIDTYGQIDFLVHSIAFAEKDDLRGRFIDTSHDGFLLAMDVSAYTLVSLCRTLEDVIADDGSVTCLSYLGSQRAALGYNVMGVAKAALESCARYLAADLGVRGIRVNTLSPGPINTISARGVGGLLEKINHVQAHAPLKRPYGPDEVGGVAVWLMSDLSFGVTGEVIYIDSGFSISSA